MSTTIQLQRVQERVAAGGHDIPEQKIRERYVNSRANLVKLMPQWAKPILAAAVGGTRHDSPAAP